MSHSAVGSKPFRFPEVRVVEASAGSGKTYALAKRYVQLALNPSTEAGSIPIRNILALTFTNKAAFEMKGRILEFLKAIALKQLSKSQEDEILGPIQLNKDQASSRAFTVMEGVIRHYNFFQVQTIDKFINALLSGCAFKIGLTANFQIKTNAHDYLQYSLDQLIDKARQDKTVRAAFENFLHHYLYLENRTGWFPKRDILAIITTLFEQSNTYGADFKEGPFAPQDIIKKKSFLLDKIKSLRQILPVQTNGGFIKAVDKFLSRSDKGFDMDSISDYFAWEDVPVRKGVEVSREAEQLWKEIKVLLKQLCHSEAYSLFNPYIWLYAQTMDGFYALASKDDCLFLNELNKRACALFDENYVTVEELYYRLATRFHHYLIDEFQDTSRLQWRNLEKMAEEALSTGGTLYYVGDRKQAIYGFRGGDVDLFDDVRRMFDAFHVQTDLLTQNRRSQKVIVEFNNTVFSLANLKKFIRQKEEYEVEKNKKNPVYFNERDMADIEKIFKTAQQTPEVKGHEGYVHMEYIDVDKKEERNEVIRTKIMDVINNLKKRFSYRDIAILTRGNQQVKEITSWLLEEGVPVESERTSDVTENSLIGELISFLRFLNSPIDNVAFATFILGDIFSKATGLKSNDMHRFIFSLRDRLANEKDLYLYTEFRRQYQQEWTAYIEEFFSNIGLYPLYELVITIYRRFNILAHWEDAQGFFMHFLELVKKSEEEHADIQSFLEYFENLQGEDLYVHVADSDAVKILTIHKAKGLQFPVVMLPYLGMDIQIGARSGEYQPSYILQQADRQMELLRIKKKYLRFSQELESIYATEYKKAFLCELNNVYVALTRSQIELYGFIPKKIKNSFNPAKFLIPEDCYIQGEPRKIEMTEAKGIPVKKIPFAEYPDWIDYLKDEFLGFDQFKNRSQRLKGDVIHYALEKIGNLSNRDKEHAVESAFREVKLRFPQAVDFPDHKQFLNQLLDQNDLKRFFYCNESKVLVEQEIVNAFGHTKRCDRLIIHEEEVWVIDFKSTKDIEGRDRKQMREYKEILQDIYPKRVIKGFLIFLDQLEAEEI